MSKRKRLEVTVNELGDLVLGLRETGQAILILGTGVRGRVRIHIGRVGATLLEDDFVFVSDGELSSRWNISNPDERWEGNDG